MTTISFWMINGALIKILLVPVNWSLRHWSKQSSYLPQQSKDCVLPLTKMNLRSSHQRCSAIKDVLRNFARPATLFKKKALAHMFSVNFAKFLRTPFLQNTSGRLLLYIKEDVWKSLSRQLAGWHLGTSLWINLFTDNF